MHQLQLLEVGGGVGAVAPLGEVVVAVKGVRRQQVVVVVVLVQLAMLMMS